MADVDLDGSWISYYEGKKARTWKVPISPSLKVELLKHINTIPKGSRWLFPHKGNANKHITGRTAYNILQSWLKVAGVDSRPFHALRSTCIKLCQVAGWTPEQVMRLTGDTLRVIQAHYLTPSNLEMLEVVKKNELL